MGFQLFCHAGTEIPTTDNHHALIGFFEALQFTHDRFNVYRSTNKGLFIAGFNDC